LDVWVELDVVDAEVVGAEAVLPGGGALGEASAYSAEEASRGGSGGRSVEALEHGLGGVVGGVAGDGAVGEEGIDVLVLARHWFRRSEVGRSGDRRLVGMAGACALCCDCCLYGRARRKKGRGKIANC
jgi:hypothetical protein